MMPELSMVSLFIIPHPAAADFINGGNMIPRDGNIFSQQFPGVAFPDGSDSGLYLRQNHPQKQPLMLTIVGKSVEWH
jgi:hypothetical protein